MIKILYPTIIIRQLLWSHICTIVQFSICFAMPMFNVSFTYVCYLSANFIRYKSIYFLIELVKESI